ncbi:hypothetical protein A2U01_0051206, partial [Trifolium medium]|nr:hypothetical protein [Trifolium medium]
SQFLAFHVVGVVSQKVVSGRLRFEARLASCTLELFVAPARDSFASVGRLVQTDIKGCRRLSLVFTCKMGLGLVT